MSSRGIPLIALVALTLAMPAALAQGPGSPQQPIKDVVFNELAAQRHDGYFEYLDSKRTGQQKTVKSGGRNRGRAGAPHSGWGWQATHASEWDVVIGDFGRMGVVVRRAGVPLIER